MREIKSFYVDEIRRRAAAIAKKATVTIAGVDYNYPITKTVIRDGFFKHYIEIEDEPVGNIEKAVLLDENNIELYVDDTLIEKGRDGWQIAFKTFLLISNEEPPATPIVGGA